MQSCEVCWVLLCVVHVDPLQSVLPLHLVEVHVKMCMRGSVVDSGISTPLVSYMDMTVTCVAAESQQPPCNALGNSFCICKHMHFGY